MKKILFIIQFDSFIKTLIPLMKALISQDYRCDVVLLKQKFYKKNWISKEILNLFSSIENKLNLFKVCKKRRVMQLIKENEYQSIVVGTTYTALLGKIDTHLKKHNLKTKLISGYVGALLSNNYDGFIKGVHRRAYSNLIWTPGKASKDYINSLNIIDRKKTKVVDTGLPRFDELYIRKNEIKASPKKDIIFFEQPTFPETKKERETLVNRLIELAILNKKCNVIIKPRFNKKIGHAHRPKYLLQDILYKIKNLPPNIKICNDNIYDLFKNCKLAITISSTAGLESLLVGIPTLFINDFCGNINKYGSDDFKKINATISFNKLFNNDIPDINYNMVKDIVRFDGKNTIRLLNEIMLLS